MFLYYCTLTSAFIALLVESPVGGKVSQIGQSVKLFDHVTVNDVLFIHLVSDNEQLQYNQADLCLRVSFLNKLPLQIPSLEAHL